MFGSLQRSDFFYEKLQFFLNYYYPALTLKNK